MNDRFRAPKAVAAEARTAGYELPDGALPVAQLLALPAFGTATVDWQTKIRSLVADRAALLLDDPEDRAVDLTVPSYIREAARRGLTFHGDDLSGDGVVDRTIREARDMAAGRITADKVTRANAWQARHAVDLDATKNSDSQDPGWPGPGAVAHLLWGINPLDPEPARRWFAAKAEAVANDRTGDTMAETRDMTYQLYGVNPNGFADSIMAADAAIDAAQTLLRDIDDPTVKQAYYLLCAADAALDEAQDALGTVDPDDELGENEPVTGDPADMGDMARDGDLADVEARTALIAAAEKRTFCAELRAVGDSGTRIGGYAARFDVEADGLSFREKIAPGAFRRSLDSGHDVFLLVNHDTTMVPLARRSAGTLAVTEDSTGLWIEADLDPTNPDAAALLSALRRGDVDKMSFAFTVADGGQRRTDEVRVLTDLDLHEVSVVTWPAYSASSVGMRSASTDLELRKRRAALLLNTRR